MTIATGAVGLFLWLLMRIPGLLLDFAPLVLFGLTMVVLGFAIYLVSKAPLRLRLMLEIATLAALLAFSAWLWRPHHDVGQAERCGRLARYASARARSAGDAQTREFFRREAAWFARRASSLRWDALLQGLIEGPTSRDRAPLGDRELIHQLSIAAEIEEHERRIGITVHISPSW